MPPSHLGARLIAEVRLARWERRIAAAAKRALDVHRVKVLASLRSAQAGISAGIKSSGFSLLSAGAPVDPFDEGTWLDTLGRELTPVAHQVFAEMGEVATDRLAEVGTVAYPEVDLSHHLDRMVGHMAGLGPDMATRLGTTLGEGFNRGESLYDLDARVRDTFGVGARRAETIARTETVGAANGVSHDVARSLIEGGLALDKEWLATGDHRTRPSHARADGQVRPFDQPFEVGGCLLQRPHDPEAFCPGEIVNCRCVLMYPEAETTPEQVAGFVFTPDQERMSLEVPASVEPSGARWAGTLSEPERQAVLDYTTGGYHAVNDALRSGSPLVGEVGDAVRALDEIVARAPELPEPVTVWRGVNYGQLRPFGASEAEELSATAAFAQAQFRPGSAVTLGGFQSTSLLVEPALDASLSTQSPGLVFEILAHRGAYLNPITRYADEAELLLGRETRYEVVDVLTEVTFLKGDELNEVKRTVVRLRQL